MFLMEQKMFLMEQKMFLGQIMELNCRMCPCMALYGFVWHYMAVYGRVASYGSIICSIVALCRLMSPFLAFSRGHRSKFI